MEEQVRKLNAEYGLDLTEDEIGEIVRQAAEIERFLQPLHETDLAGVVPILKVDKVAKK
ncbi:MAG TPA: hypothetical protein VIB79_23590 [Candidatus Binatia bacterium]|jgi:Asp-tRNA(Asn)/Glu-tRNA(Gln) amidotransferase C subunit